MQEIVWPAALFSLSCALPVLWYHAKRDSNAQRKRRVKLAGRESKPVEILVMELPLTGKSQESASKLWREIADELWIDAGLLRPGDKISGMLGDDGYYPGVDFMELDLRLQQQAPHLHGPAVTVGDIVVALARPGSPRR